MGAEALKDYTYRQCLPLVCFLILHILVKKGLTFENGTVCAAPETVRKWVSNIIVANPSAR
jgi:hypothetical protein